MRPEANLRKPVISIVEDDQFLRASLRRLMRSFGYAAADFASAADFLGSPHRHETDCLIADIHMPGMTGIELYLQLVADGHSTPTILITAYPDDASRARAIAEGVVSYLSKPFDDRELLYFVQMALERGRPDGNS